MARRGLRLLPATAVPKWQKVLPTPAAAPLREAVHGDQIGQGAQKVAPEFWWLPEAESVGATAGRSAQHPGDSAPRPAEVFREPNTKLLFTELHAKAFVGEIVPGWLTRMFGYASTGGQPSSPGPTLKVSPGQPLIVRHTNLLPAELDLETSVHLHGGHTPAHADGHPNFRTGPGETRDYYYPNPVPLKVAPGGTEPLGEWDRTETPTTLWYHDHAEDITAHNALMGLAGFCLCRDPVVEAGLPSGEFDVAIALRDVSLCQVTDDDLMQKEVKDEARSRAADPAWKFHGEARIHFNPFDHNGTLGNLVLLNGQPFPRLVAKRTTYRFRLLNASLARFYRLLFVKVNERSGAITPLKFRTIGRDTWLFDKPIESTETFLNMAARADLLIDFDQAALKDLEEWEAVYLLNTIDQKDGRGPGHGDNAFAHDPAVRPRGDVGPTTVKLPADDTPSFLMKIEVEKEPPTNRTPVVVRQPLREHDHLIKQVVWSTLQTRVFEFERGQGAWQINKRFYEACTANAVPRLWSLERWILRNNSGGWWHPIHIHLESHQMVYASVTNPTNPADKKVLVRHRDYPADARFGVPEKDPSKPTAPNSDGPGWHPDSRFDATVWNVDIKHDTTVLGPNTEVHILMRFRTFQGPFVFHCHNLNHEDMRMMFQFDPRLREGPWTDLPVRAEFWFEEGEGKVCK